jgi:hypothetical protein
MRDESFEFCFRPELKPKGVLSLFRKLTAAYRMAQICEP